MIARAGARRPIAPLVACLVAAYFAHNLSRVRRLTHARRPPFGRDGAPSRAAAAAARPLDDGPPAPVAFEGTSAFLASLRDAHRERAARPPPHCVANATTPGGDVAEEVRRFHRPIEVDWLGRDLASVAPTWSANATASCRFVARAFPPSRETRALCCVSPSVRRIATVVRSHAVRAPHDEGDTLEAALRRKTYVSAFYTPHQCGIGGARGTFNWDRDKVRGAAADPLAPGSAFPRKRVLSPGGISSRAPGVHVRRQQLRRDVGGRHATGLPGAVRQRAPGDGVARGAPRRSRRAGPVPAGVPRNRRDGAAVGPRGARPRR